jgi:hypothetical protein
MVQHAVVNLHVPAILQHTFAEIAPSLNAHAVVRAAQIRNQKRARVQSEINKLHICSSLCAARRSDNFSSERLNDALLSSQNKIKLQHRHTVCARKKDGACRRSRAKGRRGKSGNSFELFRDSTIKAGRSSSLSSPDVAI